MCKAEADGRGSEEAGVFSVLLAKASATGNSLGNSRENPKWVTPPHPTFFFTGTTLLSSALSID